ncbi:hypothetical protein VCHA43P273_400022 [Vibrio chagasii]|nr:hypothetical protein VCHA43P273_400022 [Vibrio chagasii]
MRYLNDEKENTRIELPISHKNEGKERTRSFSHEAKHLGLSPNLIKEIDKDMVEKFKALKV